MQQPRNPTTELDRMNANLDFDPANFKAREDLHERHVADFVALLRLPVREALQDEGRSLVASGWISQAERIVRPHVAPLAQSAADRSAAEQPSQDDLSQRLRQAVGSVSDDEVEEHATQLAQLLLSNWFGLLEHAMQDRSVDVLELDQDALPKTVHFNAVLAGVSAYALTPSEVANLLRRYQHGFALGSTTALSPSLQLVRGQHGWQVARAHDPIR